MGYLLNLLYFMAILISLPWLAYRSIRTKRYRAGWKEKLLGLVPRTVTHERVVWLHAVSVGEVQLLRTLLSGIEQRYPACPLCISTTTQAGMEIAAKAFAKYPVFYLPLDFTWAVRNAIQRIQPKLIVLVELEVWPNLITAAERSRCAVAIVNGRLSQRSFVGYHRLRWLMNAYFAKLSLVSVQDTVYGERFKTMGVASDRLLIAGNLKFDGACSDRFHPEVLARRNQLVLSSDNVVWVVGSTQDPEEQLAIDAFRKLKPVFPQCKLIIVPRQPDRFEEVASRLDATGFRIAYRSRMAGTRCADWDILLGDTIGELRWWWGLADLGFVGGSFGDRGGQNMIEPAAFGVSTAVGPNTKNFADTVRILLEADGLTQLKEPTDLYDWAYKNLSSSEYRRALGQRAKETAAAHRGALSRTLDALEPWMRSSL